jgi:hypothetical protein
VKKHYLYFTLGLICCINTIAIAQKDSVQVSAIEAIRTPTPHRYFTVGNSANGYKGSLSNRYSSFGPGVHLGLQFNKKKRLNGSFQLFFGQVSGDNLNAAFATRTDNRAPNSYFKTSLFVASYQLNLNLVNTKNVRWYAGTGFGITRFNVRDEQDRNLSAQPNTRAIGENYNNITLSLPLYMGINYHFVNGLAIALQAGWWNTNTPYLDNIDKLGSKTGNDNVASYRLSLWIPFQNQRKQVK